MQQATDFANIATLMDSLIIGQSGFNSLVYQLGLR